jgi:hypothetical protein
MCWERYDRKTAGGRSSQFLEWVTVFGGGIRFSKPAKERWLGERGFVEIFVDRDTHSLGFKSIAEPTMDAFKVMAQGDIKGGNPNYIVTCRSAITWWDKGLKGRHHCKLVETTHNGIIQVVPESEGLDVTRCAGDA